MARKDSEQAFIFDRRARTFDRLKWVTNPEFHLQILSVIAGLVAEMRQSGQEVTRFLDVGTGTGEVILQLKTAFPQLMSATGVGIDISRGMLWLAKEKLKDLPGTTFDHASIEEFEDDEGFDLIICRNAFHHFDELELAVERMKALIRRQGRILIVEGIAPDDYCLKRWAPVLETRDQGRHKAVYLSAENVQEKFETWFGCSVRIHKLEPVPMTLNNWLRNALVMQPESDKVRKMVKTLHQNDRRFQKKFKLTKAKDDYRFFKLSVLVEIRPDLPKGV